MKAKCCDCCKHVRAEYRFSWSDYGITDSYLYAECSLTKKRVEPTDVCRRFAKHTTK